MWFEFVCQIVMIVELHTSLNNSIVFVTFVTFTRWTPTLSLTLDLVMVKIKLQTPCSFTLLPAFTSVRCWSCETLYIVGRLRMEIHFPKRGHSQVICVQSSGCVSSVCPAVIIHWLIYSESLLPTLCSQIILISGCLSSHIWTFPL